MTTTPTASPELPDLDRLQKIADDLEVNFQYKASDELREIIASARRAQPEGEAPQAGLRGYKSVPLNPCVDQVKAGLLADPNAHHVTDIYIAMVNASTAQQAEGKLCYCTGGVNNHQSGCTEGFPSDLPNYEKDKHAESGAQKVPEPSRASRIECALRQIVDADDGQALTQALIESGRAALAAKAEAPAAGDSVALNLEAQLRAVVRERDELRAQQAAAPGSLPDQSQFEAQARYQGATNFEPVHPDFMVCNNGWTPATYRDPMTELAWRVWANKRTAPSAPGTPEAPAKHGDAKDAARYRWLRDHHIGDDPEAINLQQAKRSGLNAAVDAAMRATQLDGGQGEGA